MTTPGQLFDPDELDSSAASGASSEPERTLEPGERLVRVLPDVPGLDRGLDYICRPSDAAMIAVGSIVLIEIGARKTEGWVTEVDVEPTKGVKLRYLRKVASVGPDAETIDLARWAAWRWHGRVGRVLKAASPPSRVRARPSVRHRAVVLEDDAVDDFAREAFTQQRVTLAQIGPCADRLRFALAAASLGTAIVLCPTVGEARRLSSRLARHRVRTHLQPAAWVGGYAGGVVVGARSAAWAPAEDLAAVLVFDEHDEAYKEERSPTWHARDVAIERARRAGVPCVLVSSTPSLEAVAAADRRIDEPRGPTRRAWPIVSVIDQRSPEPGRSGLLPTATIDAMRHADRVIAVLNRKGRAQMLACASCGELVRTENGEHLMAEVDGLLVSAITGESRPLICAVCTGTKLKRLRLGVSRAAEELQTLLRRPVVEVTATTDRSRLTDGAVVMGTAAALYETDGADVVAFLDFDQELHAPRLRAAEQAMGLVGRAARLCGPRRAGSSLIIQTRDPDHRVVQAAARADAGLFVEEEMGFRRDGGLPPFSALAELSGPGAASYATSLRGLPAEASVTVLGPRADGRYLARSPGTEQLIEALAAGHRPKERLRVVVDPLRV